MKTLSTRLGSVCKKYIQCGANAHEALIRDLFDYCTTGVSPANRMFNKEICSPFNLDRPDPKAQTPEIQERIVEKHRREETYRV